MDEMRRGFEAQRKAGINVDWFTWQIAWHDAVAALASAPAQQWVSVKDRLPEDNQMVAVFDPDNRTLQVWPAQWDASNQSFTAGHWKSAGWFEKDEVTHWMSLPEAPESSVASKEEPTS